MRQIATICGGLLLACLLAGCNTSVPPTSIKQPMTARPPIQAPVLPADGAIFHSSLSEHPLFEDVRARNVGDTLTIVVSESTAGSRSNSDGSTMANSSASGTPTVTSGTSGTGASSALATLLKPINISSNNSDKSASTGSGAASQTLTGTITVTVIEVLPNGNLVVSGEKQVALTNSNDFIRFSGVVNPIFISNNTVQSTQVADAHLEYKNAGEMSQVINDAKSLGFLGRFFKSVLPF